MDKLCIHLLSGPKSNQVVVSQIIHKRLKEIEFGVVVCLRRLQLCNRGLDTRPGPRSGEASTMALYLLGGKLKAGIG